MSETICFSKFLINLLTVLQLDFKTWTVRKVILFQSLTEARPQMGYGVERTPLADQIISKPNNFSAEIELTPQILSSILAFS